jgi:hypothetical protein
MEAFGIALAAYESDAAPGFILIKGVSDWADPAKDDAWQRYAAESAARFAVALVGSFEDAGTTKRPQAHRRGSPTTFTGPQKIHIARRLGDDWLELAVSLDISSYDRGRFERGREGIGIIDWLDQHDRLSALADALRTVNREDILESLPPR